MIQRTDKGVAFAIFSSSYWGLGLDDRVDATDCMAYVSTKSSTISMRCRRTSMGNFCGHFEQHMVLDVALTALGIFARHFGRKASEQAGRSSAGVKRSLCLGVRTRVSAADVA